MFALSVLSDRLLTCDAPGRQQVRMNRVAPTTISVPVI
jgi:hypothetical protein